MSEPSYRALLRMDDESWKVLPQEIRGQPVFFRVVARNKIEIWPSPPNVDNLTFGVAFK